MQQKYEDLRGQILASAWQRILLTLLHPFHTLLPPPILKLRRWPPGGCPGKQAWSQAAMWPKPMMLCPGDSGEGNYFSLQQALALRSRVLAPLEFRQV